MIFDATRIIPPGPGIARPVLVVHGNAVLVSEEVVGIDFFGVFDGELVGIPEARNARDAAGVVVDNVKSGTVSPRPVVWGDITCAVGSVPSDPQIYMCFRQKRRKS